MNVLQVLICVLAGMVLMGLLVWFTMPVLMLIRQQSRLTYDETVSALEENIAKKQDWKVLVVNDYKKSTEAFASLDRVGSVTICNPRYASKILSKGNDRIVVAFMPLEIGVYEDGKGRVFVSKLNVSLLGKMFGGNISKVMGKAGKDLAEVTGSVTAV